MSKRYPYMPKYRTKPNLQLKKKYGKIDGWDSRRGKVHVRATRRRYACGQNIDERTDTLCVSIPKSKVREGIFCKICFPDIIVYPDVSLDEELFKM